VGIFKVCGLYNFYNITKYGFGYLGCGINIDVEDSDVKAVLKQNVDSYN